MARADGKVHDTGDFFPVLEVSTIGGGTVMLPGDFIGSWGVVLLYCGGRCPFCRRQLQDFQNSIAEFERQGIRLIAASSDPLDDAVSAVEGNGVTFTVGYGLDAKEVSGLTGAFYEESNSHIHATGFILAPDGRIATAVYSTGPVGRLVAEDALEFIRRVIERQERQ